MQWIDPDEHKDKLIKYNGYAAVKGQCYHKTVNTEAIHNDSLKIEHIDGENWEVFLVSHRLDLDGQTYYYGSFLEGIGMFNVMIPKENIRELTDGERETLAKANMGMYGCHTGNLSYTYGLGVINNFAEAKEVNA